MSNETPNIDVFFDNLQVTHIRGPILEETHYYPFGLTMAGISSKALAFGEPENKYQKFQGQPLDDDLGVRWYGFKWRNHDPQIGRFIQIDPLAAKYVHNSTYAFSENRVIDGVELEGLEVVLVNEQVNPIVHKVGSQNSDKSAIHVYAHGSQTKIVDDRNSDSQGHGGIDINNKKSFSKLIKESSEAKQWKNKDEENPVVVVLHACRTGRPITKNGKKVSASFAEKVSTIENVIVVAPDERDEFSKGFFGGVSEDGPTKYEGTDENGNYATEDKKGKVIKKATSEKGSWIIYKKGKEVGRMSGNWTPNGDETKEIVEKNEASAEKNKTSSN